MFFSTNSDTFQSKPKGTSLLVNTSFEPPTLKIQSDVSTFVRVQEKVY